MTTLSVRNFDSPDETRTPDKTKVEVVDLGSAKAACLTAEPGWRWSECIKPVVGTDSCQARHIGVVVSGRMHSSRSRRTMPIWSRTGTTDPENRPSFHAAAARR